MTQLPESLLFFFSSERKLPSDRCFVLRGAGSIQQVKEQAVSITAGWCTWMVLGESLQNRSQPFEQYTDRLLLQERIVYSSIAYCW